MQREIFYPLSICIAERFVLEACVSRLEGDAVL